MTDKEKLEICIKALRKIANTGNDGRLSLERYCMIVDGISCEALAEIDADIREATQ